MCLSPARLRLWTTALLWRPTVMAAVRRMPLKRMLRRMPPTSSLTFRAASMGSSRRRRLKARAQPTLACAPT
ncbi:major surface protease gp63, putative [Leishmania tarentolae]|uniref:Major surface protease gp63, putative n=1 Tax=Leishmania tarentolae TaxID=5689 RepID=A0A640KWU9_LEITA|nr:major surface protease gp63, putative [Leishmania tarentolae]GET94036.1 major surface protease gp63, putative [Leishmania tarentolae]